VLCINAFDKKICLTFNSYLDTFWEVYVHVEPIQINCKCGDHIKNVTIVLFLYWKIKKSIILLPHLTEQQGLIGLQIFQNLTTLDLWDEGSFTFVFWVHQLKVVSQ